MNRIESLERLLAQGQDNALLRYGLGSAYLQAGQAAEAVPHLRRAVEQDPQYSAAWKLLGKALTALGRADEAMAAYRQGIAVAEARGDKQAAREMAVFLRRLERAGGDG